MSSYTCNVIPVVYEMPTTSVNISMNYNYMACLDRISNRATAHVQHRQFVHASAFKNDIESSVVYWFNFIY